MRSKTSRNPESGTNGDTLSLTALIVVLTLTNVWFVSQVMPYAG